MILFSRWPVGLWIIVLNLFFFYPANAVPVCSASDSSKLPMGIWRAEIIRPDGNRIAFNFQTRQIAGKIIIHIINGAERLLVDNIRQRGDSLFIDMPFFDSHFALRISEQQKLEGSYIRNYGTRIAVTRFEAGFNNPERFPVTKPPVFNISGRWAVHFKGANDSTEAVGEFKQSGSQVRGTFLTITGDYRFLDGVVSGDTLKLSTFDGGHAYSFVCKIVDTNKMAEGFYYAGAVSVETWTGEKNEQAKLPDEYSQTHLKDSANAFLHFRFPDLDNHLVSISDPDFKNKVVIVQLLGSWCPNCMDETRFLSAWYLQNKTRGVRIIGLAYERTSSFADARRLLQPFITRFNVTYPILATGVAISDTLRSEKTIPEIESIVGFPTTIFIDKKGMVRKIHTGFNGPGTGEHYEVYKKEFDRLVSGLLTE
ncbi:MAG TPA: TlpA disulfide reductase family protein [Puia sp.]